MIKGLEALTTECLTAARRYGVEEAVLDSLHASFPSPGWHGELADYPIGRVAQHGRGRAEEMREVVKTLQDVALSGTMSQAIAESQLALVERMAQKQIDYQMLLPFSWQQTVDKLA
jgi:3-hydroxyisobutyrate dehydrogenase-like beta-hydroxyacid dehydrogenase